MKIIFVPKGDGLGEVIVEGGDLGSCLRSFLLDYNPEEFEEGVQIFVED